jgi:hypothetical protein
MITDRSRSVKTVLSSLIRHDWVLEVFWRICVLLFVPSLRGSSESCPNLTHVFMLFSDRRQLTLSSLLHLVFNCSITTAATASHTTDFLRTQSHYFGWQCTTCPTSPIELSLPSSLVHAPWQTGTLAPAPPFMTAGMRPLGSLDRLGTSKGYVSCLIWAESGHKCPAMAAAIGSGELEGRCQGCRIWAPVQAFSPSDANPAHLLRAIAHRDLDVI